MKYKKSIIIFVLASMQMTTSNAALDSILNGMFLNATAPNVTDSQFRGTLSGGSVYVRTPTTRIQLFSLDPPRFSAGCGGVDLYLGSFSFISAAKLTQFLRNVAQNAAPLLFKMAVTSLFPNLAGAIDKFQQIAQDMGKQNMDSCKMATGLVDGFTKNPSGAMADLVQNVSNGWTAVKGWATDFAEAAVSSVAQPGFAVKQTDTALNADGRKMMNEFGNLTWNVLNTRSFAGQLLSLGDSEPVSRQIIMALIGTEVVAQPTLNDTSQQVSPRFGNILRLTQLVDPKPDSSGTIGLPVYDCDEPNFCKFPTAGSVVSHGIKGYVELYMYGAAGATGAQPGSIVYQLTTCNNASQCGLTSAQLKFLNNIGKVPVVALMMHAQRNPAVFGAIAPVLIDQMTNEVAVLYAAGLIQTITRVFNETQTPQVTTFDKAMSDLIADQRILQAESSKGIDKINGLIDYIDRSNRSLGNGLGFKL